MGMYVPTYVFFLPADLLCVTTKNVGLVGRGALRSVGSRHRRRSN